MQDRLKAFLDLVQFAEKGKNLSKLALALLHRHRYVVNNENALKIFLINWIILPLQMNSGPDSSAYSEAVKTARLFRHQDPIKFARNIFKKAYERLKTRTS